MAEKVLEHVDLSSMKSFLLIMCCYRDMAMVKASLCGHKSPKALHVYTNTVWSSKCLSSLR